MRRVDVAPLTAEGGALTGYLHDPDNGYTRRGPRPALLIIPGGGYRKLVEHEGDPVAWEFFPAGFQTFILRYSLWDPEDRRPLGWTPLAQAARALRLLRERSGEWNIRPDAVAVMGFSAGGHLAGCCAALWDRPELRERLGAADRLNRPDAAVLAYPVVRLEGPFAHRSSRERLAGTGDAGPFDLPGQVRADTPPCFVWSTMADEHVPAENSLELVQSLRRAGVPCELHLYMEGRHGLGLATAEAAEPHPRLASWAPLCKRWLGGVFGFPVSMTAG